MVVVVAAVCGEVLSLVCERVRREVAARRLEMLHSESGKVKGKKHGCNRRAKTLYSSWEGVWDRTLTIQHDPSVPEVSAIRLDEYLRVLRMSPLRGDLEQKEGRYVGIWGETSFQGFAALSQRGRESLYSFSIWVSSPSMHQALVSVKHKAPM